MKKLLDIEQVKEGMKLAQDILEENHRILVPRDTILTDKLIESIKNITKKSQVLVFLEDAKIGIVVENVNKRLLELNSGQITIKDMKKRLEVKKKLRDMEESIEKTFKNLSINGVDSQAQKEINDTVENIKQNIDINIELLEEITDIKNVDTYLYAHSLNVSILANLIGRWLKLPKNDLDILIKAGLLHDIGKLKVNPDVLNKPGKLTDEEFEEMKKHALHSYNMLKKSSYNDDRTLKAVVFHHEKEDGSGYPTGIKGENIPIHARILAIADIFDAMTSERVYKKRVSPFKVLEMFQNQNFGKLDMNITMLFVKKFSEYYLGSEVMLSNGETAKIVSLNYYEINKPLLKLNCGSFLDISKNRNVEILDFINN